MTNLWQVVGERGDPGLAPSVALGYLAQAADALDRLHGGRPPAAHGAVEPANLVLDGDGRVTLTDAGPAAPAYAAPELADGANPTPASDIYALAATAVCLLTGRAPGPLGADWAGLAPAEARRFERVLRRGLDPDPTRRPRAATELVERLRARGADLPTGVITFCLTDIEGSTALWEAQPGQMPRVIARHHALVAEVCEDHGGHLPVSQGEGDSTLSAYERASDALAAALAIQQRLAAEAWPDQIELRVRMGLHTGEAQLRDGDYFGAALSRTARVRGLAGGAQVLLSQATAQLVADHLPDGASLRDLGEHPLKGLDRPERVFVLCAPGLVEELAPATEAGAAEAAEGLAAASLLPGGRGDFVGRGEDLERMGEAFEAVTGGERRLVLVGGDPGIGKTRLASEFARACQGRGAVVLYGRSDEEGLVPYQPFVEGLRHYLTHASPAALRSQLGGSGELARLVPELRARLPDLPEPVSGDADIQRYRLFEAVAALLAAATRDVPMVMVLDDLHWADKPTLLLLRHVVRHPQPARLLLVGTYRDTELNRTHPLADAMADLRRDGLFERVSLAGLEEPQVGELISSLAGGAAPEDLAHAVYAETEGNPFFIGEVLRHLSESGAIREQDGRLVADRPIDQMGIPEGVKEVIGRRLSRLPEDANAALRMGAVIGRDFRVEVLERVLEVSPDALLDALEEALEAHLLEEVPGAVGRYSFSHALVVDTLYDEFSTTRRVRLHRRIGEALEELYREDPEPHLSELAYHFTEAAPGGDPEKAIDYSARAASQASAQFAYEEAAGHYERALEALDLCEGEDRARRCELLLLLGHAREESGDDPRARAAFERAAEIAEGLGDPELLGRAVVGFNWSWGLYITPEGYETGCRMVESALEQVPEGDGPLRAMLLGSQSFYSTEAREQRPSVDAEAIAMARRLGDPAGLAQSLSWFCYIALFNDDQMEQQHALSNELLQVAEATGALRMRIEAHQWRSIHLLQLGEASAGEREQETSAELAEVLRQPYYLWWLVHASAARALMGGRLAEGEELAGRSFEMSSHAQDPVATPYFAALVQPLYRERGRLEELRAPVGQLRREDPKRSYWAAAGAVIELHGGRGAEARALVGDLAAGGFEGLSRDDFSTGALALLAESCAWLGEAEHAAILYERLLPHDGRNVIVGALAGCLGPASLYLGLLAATMERWKEAAAHFEGALGLSEAMGARPWLARAQAEYAALLVTRDTPGDRERALGLAEQALENGRELDLSRTVAQAEAVLGR